MLLQFGFKNFKSFRDDTILDLTATKICEYSNRIIEVGNEKVLPVAAIFGPNAHGKSNVIQALRYMHNYVLESFNYGGDTKLQKLKSEFRRPTPFLFDKKTKEAESSFEVYFIDSEESGAKTYNYGFSINNNGVNEEWLNYRTKSSRGEFKRIFYRDVSNNILDLIGIPIKFQENIKLSLHRETLVVSLGAKLQIEKLQHIMNWFINNETVNFGEPIENLFFSRMIPDNFANDKSVQKKVVKYLSVFDSSIIDFEVEKINTDKENNEIGYNINVIHKMVNSDKTGKIPLEEESSGTLKMFGLYQLIENVLKTGGVLFIDELNAKLHPLLVRAFLIMFLDTDINKKHAQLIFTTHDSWQLNGNGLRRDEIWFTEKGENGVSTLFSLVDFVNEDGIKIRRDENYEKNYLLGKYGAIPTLKYFDMFKGE